MIYLTIIMPENRNEERNYYWSLRDIPKFLGKGEQPFSHIMEFEDYLIASGVRIEPEEDNAGRRVEVDYKDIINKFKTSLKNNARICYSMYIDGRIPDLYSEEGWKAIKSRFLTYFNPIGSTKEQQIKAWKELKWKPEEEKLTNFVFRFNQLAHELYYTDDQQISHFVLCIPRGLYLYLEGAKTVPDAVENFRKGIALGGLDTFNFASEMVDNRKPVVPFMAVKEHRGQVNTEDTIKVVMESIQDSIYENNKTMMRQLDKIGDTMGKIGDRIANVVEDFQKKQSPRNSRNRYRDRSIVEIEITQQIITGIEVEIEEDQTQERIETINKDQIQDKDIMIEKISVTIAIEMVIQHMSVLNLRTI